MHRIVAVTMLVAAGAFPGWTQPTLQLKGRNLLKRELLIAAPDTAPVARRLTPNRSHRIVPFAGPPAESDLDRLREQGATVLGYVPDNAVVVSVPDHWSPGELPVLNAAALSATDKWSPDLDVTPGASELLSREDEPPRRDFVVEYYPDVDPGDARTIAGLEGMRVLENPDVVANHLLVEGTRDQAFGLTGWDEVAYVFPASPDLAEGHPVQGCAGALSAYGMVGQYVSRIGEGWEGAGKNAIVLGYAIENMSARLAPAAGQTEIRRALAEWARHIQVDFREAGRSTDSRHIDIRFASRSHGDPFAFDGPGRVLAHTFYPSPPNPEPVAGDLHLDDEEPWRIGTDIDLYSVVLHELGHALGLGHSDKPGSVMYAYYRRADTLTEEDIAAARELYAARNTTTSPAPSPAPAPSPSPQPPATPSAPTPAPQPPATPSQPDRTAPTIALVSHTATSVITTAASITLRGTAADNTGVTQVTWSSNVAGAGAAAGTTEWTATIPLARGYNYLVVRAWDAAGNTGWRSLVVTRR